MPQSRSDDSRDRSMETVSVCWSHTPSPPSRRTISINMSTSHFKSKRPLEVSQGEVDIMTVSTVVSLVPPEVVNGQEEAVASQQPQQMKGIRRRNTRQQVLYARRW